MLTSASCLLESFNYTIDNLDYNIPVEVNAYTPSVPSMFTVYLGVTNKSETLNSTTSGLGLSVSRVIIVI